jgi:hypothetical protein
MIEIPKIVSASSRFLMKSCPIRQYKSRNKISTKIDALIPKVHRNPALLLVIIGLTSAALCPQSEVFSGEVSGTIFSISDESNAHDPSECRWILAPDGALSVTLRLQRIPAVDSCLRVFSCVTARCLRPYELLELSGSPFSASNVPGPIISSTGAMMIALKTAGIQQFDGLEASYISSLAQCHGGLYTAVGSGSGAPNTSFPSVIFGDAALFAHYTFGTDSRLKDSSHASGDLVPSSSAAPAYVSDCRWPGAECSQLSSEADSSGGGQYFSLPTFNLGRMSAEAGFSICTWFVFDSVRSWSRIFDMGNGEASNNVILGRFDGTSTLYAEYWANSADSRYFESPNAIVEGVWRHACLINKMRKWVLYDNGELSALDISNFDLVDVDLHSNHIGRNNWNVGSLLQGKIDEFRIYRRALSTKDVGTLFRFHGTRKRMFSAPLRFV